MGVVSVENIVKYLDGEDFETVELIPTEIYKKADAEKDPELHTSDSADAEVPVET